LTGFIVVGPERTGLLYTPEDLEFMATMGQQATASIVTVRLSEDPARTREFGAAGSFAQAYNAQAAVDACGQVIIACGVTPSASDAEQLVPTLRRIVATTSRRPATLMADAGFFSEANRVAAEQAGVDVYIPPDRDAHGHALAAGRRHPAPSRPRECADARQAPDRRRRSALSVFRAFLSLLRRQAPSPWQLPRRLVCRSGGVLDKHDEVNGCEAHQIRRPGIVGPMPVLTSSPPAATCAQSSCRQ
jgi:Transposase DDE domain